MFCDASAAFGACLPCLIPKDRIFHTLVPTYIIKSYTKLDENYSGVLILISIEDDRAVFRQVWYEVSDIEFHENILVV